MPMMVWPVLIRKFSLKFSHQSWWPSFADIELLQTITEKNPKQTTQELAK